MTDSHDQPTEVFSRRAAREGAAAPQKSGAGIRGLIAKHPSVWLFSTLGVVFLLLATGALFAGIASGSGQAAGVPLPTESEVPPRPQPSALPAGTHLRTCSIAPATTDPLLGALSASIVNATTGEVLFDRGGTTPTAPANVQHLLAAATAIKVLGSGAQFSTRVIDGSSPGTIVLVGGGDATLATTSDSVYEGAPLLSDLATAAMAAYALKHPGKPVTNIVLDATLWGDPWDSTWPTSDRSNGYLSMITPLMVDGDRFDATDPEGPRSDDPVARAGEAFAAAAGLPSVTFSRGTAVGATVLAEVKSQPLSTLIGQMLESGDNTLAEMMVRAAAKTAGLDGSTTAAGLVIGATMKDLGLDITGLVAKDGSGESPANLVPPLLVSRLMVKIKANEADLGVISAGLPIAGQTGDLYDRFTDANAVAAGQVVAKPGWISGERSLAGIINAADGTPLAFAFYSLGDAVTRDTKAALDTLATAAFTCGDNLSNN